MRSFKLSAELFKRHSFAFPADLEQTQHDLTLALLHDFDRKFFAGRLGRLLMLLAGSCSSATRIVNRVFDTVPSALLSLAGDRRRWNYTPL